MTASNESEQDFLKALHHPFRRSLLRRFLEAGRPLSPKQLEVMTQEPLSNISYHVRELARFRAVELVDQKLTRGSVEHFYRPTASARRDPVVAMALGLPSKAGTARGKNRKNDSPRSKRKSIQQQKKSRGD